MLASAGSDSVAPNFAHQILMLFDYALSINKHSGKFYVKLTHHMLLSSQCFRCDLGDPKLFAAFEGYERVFSSSVPFFLFLLIPVIGTLSNRTTASDGCFVFECLIIGTSLHSMLTGFTRVQTNCQTSFEKKL